MAMLKSGNILLKGDFENTGFGFSCLQQVTTLNLDGKFEYINANNVLIQISGEKKTIQKFHQWCISQNYILSGKLIMQAEFKNFKEFQIINQL